MKMTKAREKELKSLTREWTKEERKEWALSHPKPGDEWARKLYQQRKEGRRKAGRLKS